MEINAKITKGVAVKLTTSQPNCDELALQFINQPEVTDDRATKPKTKSTKKVQTIYNILKKERERLCSTLSMDNVLHTVGAVHCPWTMYCTQWVQYIVHGQCTATILEFEKLIAIFFQLKFNDLGDCSLVAICFSIEIQ